MNKKMKKEFISEQFLFLLNQLQQSFSGNLFPALLHVQSMRVIFFVVVLEHLQQLLLVFDTVVGYILQGFLFHFLYQVEHGFLFLDYLNIFALLYLNVFPKRVNFLPYDIHHLNELIHILLYCVSIIVNERCSCPCRIVCESVLCLTQLNH